MRVEIALEISMRCQISTLNNFLTVEHKNTKKFMNQYNIIKK